jgi:hypothetical protein
MQCIEWIKRPGRVAFACNRAGKYDSKGKGMIHISQGSESLLAQRSVVA